MEAPTSEVIADACVRVRVLGEAARTAR
jgi:hypothetical protein